MKRFSLLLATCAASLCGNIALAAASPDGSTAKPMPRLASVEEKVTPPRSAPLQKIEPVQAGAYLAGRFAQQAHDWNSASRFVNVLLGSNLDQPEITRRAMVLAMGSGDYPRAVKLAKEHAASENKENISIAQMFLIADAFAHEDYKGAQELLTFLPADSTARFVRPFIEAWSQAAVGKLKIGDLKENTVQVYHAILVSDYLKDHGEIARTLSQAMGVEEISASEMEQIADVYAHVGMKDDATKIYQKILVDWPDDKTVSDKLATVKNGTNKPLFQKIESPRQGMAQAFLDISQMLLQDQNDESARIFANMALLLAPKLADAHIVLAQISGRHKQYEQAIAHYKMVPAEHTEYLNTHYKISEIYEDSGQKEKALAILDNLVAKQKDIEAQIRIGDLYRRQGSFGLALESYNKAATTLGNKIPEDFWHLLYVRGMVYEQIGNWELAEKDLKDALEYRPDHPYILNYLGYAWADKGVNLQQALEMIAKAADLRPTDGYIVDSLGWVKYRMGDYQGAASVLEQAVSLMPYDPTINDHLGDAYWMVGRHMEARFQWSRAKNHSEDEAVIKAIEQKIASGLQGTPVVVEANNSKK